MGCRCTDISNYKMDIEKLTNAADYAQELIGYTNDVRSTLDELKSEYNETLEATGEFLGEFAQLDKDANANANGILAQIEDAKALVEYRLRGAEYEDHEWHKTH